LVFDKMNFAARSANANAAESDVALFVRFPFAALAAFFIAA
jgi:hypothetical protein